MRGSHILIPAFMASLLLKSIFRLHHLRRGDFLTQNYSFSNYSFLFYHHVYDYIVSEGKISLIKRYILIWPKICMEVRRLSQQNNFSTNSIQDR